MIAPAIKLKEQITLQRVVYLSTILFIIAFCALNFFPAEVRKLFYAAGYLLVLTGLLGYRQLARPLSGKLLSLALLLFSLAIFTWLLIYDHHGAMRNIYDAYKTAAKIVLLTALICFFISNINVRVPAASLNALLIAAALVVNSYAIYQGAVNKMGRIELAFDRATVVAYILTFINLVMLNAIIELRHRYRYPLFIVGALIAMAAVIYTGTRAAILACPVLFALLLILHPRVSKVHLGKVIAIFLASLLIVGLVFKGSIISRYNDLKSDLVQYEANNSVTSFGARIAMFQSGLVSGLHAPLGQSAEQRAADINQQIEQKPVLSGAHEYLSVHLHNEFIDNFSLRGLAGLFSLGFLYVALLLHAWYIRSALLGVIALAMVTFGLSDVVLFSREGCIIFSLAVILSLLSAKANHRESPQP